VKLHLGCGERYLDGYRNIDQPPASHTVQTRSVADEHADLTSLRYPAESIDEVRLHHVFEHFPRPIAMALAASWRSWLRPDGVLHVEVPDFERTARSVLRPFASRSRRLVGIRHLFGSHEAPWAVHWEGWTEQTLKEVFRACGLVTERTYRGKFRHTYNICVIGKRDVRRLDRHDVEQSVRNWLANYLVDGSATEQRLLDVWMDQYRQQVERTWAT
jgi:predicted SAM-dependent methyltransferase